MRKGVLVLLGLILVLVACQVPTPFPIPGFTPPPTISPSSAPAPITATPTPRPLIQVTVRVHIPDNTPIHKAILFTEVEPLTGITVMPRRTAMKPLRPHLYEITLTVPWGTVLTYRYERQQPDGTVVQEHRPDGQPVRYRMLRVFGPMVVEDWVARWTDTPYIAGEPGRLQGRVLDATTGRPVPDAVVFVGGYQVLADAQGFFLVEGLMPGLHNMVVMDLDGRYHLFQQLAEIAPQATTPADIPMQPATLVPVRFVAYPPAQTPAGAPLRLIGTYYATGHVFGDVRGGLTVVASRAPQLTYENGRYTLTLNLPAGEEFAYKFTLGDGLINAELDAQGRPIVHRLLVPEQAVEVQIPIARWNWPNTAPTWIEVTVPENTPVQDIVSIQFQYNTWGEPLPIWYLGDRRWAYMVFGPIPEGTTVRYRYCRNEQCEVAPEAGSAGQYGRGLGAGSLPQQMRDTVEAWAHFAPAQPLTLVAPLPSVKPAEFQTGLAWVPGYHPGWAAYEGRALDEMASLGAHVAVFQPTWQAHQAAPYPVWYPVPGTDALVPDILRWVQMAHARGLQAWLYPRLRYPQGATAWWKDAPRDFPWWQAWFERYRRFLLHFATLAAQGQADALVIGGREGAWSFPDRTITEGVVSAAPADAEARWLDLIQALRTVYPGPIYWAVTDSEGLNVPAGLAQAVDGFYLEWHPPAYTGNPADETALLEHMAKDIQTRLFPWALEHQKPVWIGVGFPAAQGALTGCLQPLSGTECISEDTLWPPDAVNRVKIDTEVQWRALHAALQALDSQDWPRGVIVRGWYPPVAALEPSESVHGKPAEQVVGYWFRGWKKESGQ